MSELENEEKIIETKAAVENEIINDTPEETVIKEQNKGKGFAITSLVLGIISMCIFFYMPISIPCSILGIIFGAMGKSRNQGGMATAGLILSIIALSIIIFVFIALVLFGFATAMYLS